MDLNLDLGSARYPVAFVVALALALYLTPIIRRGAIKYQVVDHPDTHLKQHREPTPYLGGVAVYLAFLMSLALSYQFTGYVLALLLSASIVVMLGLFDDLKVLSPGLKLLGQTVAALILVKAGIMIHLTFLPEWLALALTVLWLVGVTNAMNLIDVSDGLASGVAAIGGTFLYVVALWNGDTMIAMMTLSLVGASVGFLAYNRAPAKIFLGDTGSMFLGFMLGALAMIGHYTFHHTVSAAAPVVILGVPIFDTFFVMGARALRRLPLMHGSPDHFAVRLRNHGWRAGKIAVVAYACSVGLGGAGLALCLVPVSIAYAITGALALAAGLVVVGLWRIGRNPEERRARLGPGEGTERSVSSGPTSG